MRKQLFNPMTMNAEEIKNLVNRVKQLKEHRLDKFPKILKHKRISIFTSNQARNFVSQIVPWSVTQILGGRILPVTFDWSSLSSKNDLGKMISRCYDLVLMETKHCKDIHEFSEGCCIPVIYCACSLYQPLQGIANIVTIEEHFGRLDNLNFAWVGPGCSSLNTYMMILPKFGIQIDYNCTPNPEFPVHPICHNKSTALSKIHSTHVDDHNTPREALKNANIIATTAHEIKCQKVSLKMLEEANSNWIFLHNLPRGGKEADSAVFNHERNLVWQNFNNLIYVCIAVIIDVLDIEIQSIEED